MSLNLYQAIRRCLIFIMELLPPRVQTEMYSVWNAVRTECTLIYVYVLIHFYLYTCFVYVYLLWLYSLTRAEAVSFFRFLYHTQLDTLTFSRTPLNE
jgi:Na+/H+-dicarboxylate symporter